jgi:hypothetical protein
MKNRKTMKLAVEKAKEPVQKGRWQTNNLRAHVIDIEMKVSR